MGRTSLKMKLRIDNENTGLRSSEYQKTSLLRTTRSAILADALGKRQKRHDPSRRKHRIQT